MIPIAEFSEMYNLSSQHIYVAMKDGTIPEVAIDRSTPRRILIDDKYIVRRDNFRNKIMKQNTDIYFILHDFYTDSHLSRILSEKTGIKLVNWQSWISQRLFRPSTKSMLSNKVSMNHWHFNRILRRYVRGVL